MSNSENGQISEGSWSFDEFLAFLLIYASHADINFSKEEKDLILRKVTPETFEKMYNHFMKLTDYQALESILSYKDLYYATNGEKVHLFDELKDLFHADGEFSSLEKELLMFLERLM